MFVSRSAVNINVLDGRRGDCATRHSAALRAVALARARCTLSPLSLPVCATTGPPLCGPPLPSRATPLLCSCISAVARITSPTPSLAPVGRAHDAPPLVALSLCWHVARASSRNILLPFRAKIFLSVSYLAYIFVFSFLFLSFCLED